MIYIEADALADGLYNIKDGEIFKYKAKGGTVRSYEMGEIVQCKDCKYWVEWMNKAGSCERLKSPIFWVGMDAWDFCSHGERREVEE